MAGICCVTLDTNCECMQDTYKLSTAYQTSHPKNHQQYVGFSASFSLHCQPLFFARPMHACLQQSERLHQPVLQARVRHQEGVLCLRGRVRC